MIKFRQKEFSEYDAMRELYVELMKRSDKNKFPIIDTSALIPILKGNNIVIERFVISTSIFGTDKYRMYLKIGAKAKLPDEVRLSGRVYDKRLLNVQVKLKGGYLKKQFSDKEKLFGKGGPADQIQTELSPNLNLSTPVTKLLGEAIKYDKKSRSLVLEFSSINDAINALNILPFGLNYKIYLLDS